MNIVMMKAVFSAEVLDQDTFYFPYLGQLAFLGVLDGLTFACNVPSIRNYNPACVSTELQQQFENGLDNGTIRQTLGNATWPDQWFDPADAWKTVDSIYNLMLCRGNEGFLKHIVDIRDEVTNECRDLRFLLETASYENRLFKIEIEEMEEPPFPLKEWTNRYEECTYREIRSALEAAGIIIRDGDDYDF